MKILMLVLLMLSAAASVQAGESSRRYASCAPVYRYTRQIGCRTEYRCGIDRCGQRYQYPVRVITYADYYSDGSCRTYTRISGW